MKLKDYAHLMAGLPDRIVEMLDAQDDLEICLDIYRRYASGKEPASLFMDRDRALDQLLIAVARVVAL